LPGIIETTGDLATGTLIVTYDSGQVDEEEIIQAIEDLGYSVAGSFTP
jgi:copper chaperone CopZ